MVIIIFLNILLVLIVIGMIKYASSSLGDAGWKQALYVVSYACIITGAISFIAPIIFSGVNNKVSNSFEWPIGQSSSVLESSKGLYIISHTPSGRVQIYDQSLQFLRGWSVDSNGGDFRIFLSDNDTFNVFTARGGKILKYNVSGQLILEEENLGDYPEKNDALINLSIPTPKYLWAYTHPLKAWLLLFLGLVLHNLTAWLGREKDIKRIG